MKAVVIGATGHVGNAIVRELLSRNIEVTATSRQSRPAFNLADTPVRFVQGDADCPGQFDAWIGGQDIVVDAAAPYPLSLLNVPPARDPIEHAIRRTQNLLSSVVRQGVSLVYVGSYATTTRRGLDALRYELTRRSHPYFAVKEIIESQILDAARRGVMVVSVNPTMCMGPWDLRQLEYCIVPLLLRGQVPAMTNQVLNIIDVRDVASAAITALQVGKFGEPIPLTGHNITVDMLCSWICEIGCVPPPRMYVSPTLATVGSYLLEVALGLAGQETPLPSVFTMLAGAFDCPAPHRRQLDLGIVSRPLSQTLLDAVQWYRLIGYC